jgi:hypothetical protein
VKEPTGGAVVAATWTNRSPLSAGPSLATSCKYDTTGQREIIRMMDSDWFDDASELRCSTKPSLNDGKWDHF